MSISQSDIDALLAAAGESGESYAGESGGEERREFGAEVIEPAPPPPAVAARPEPSEAVARKPSISGDLKRIMRMRVPVIVTLAQRELPLQSVLTWTPGSIIEFDIPADAELTLVIANKPIGSGHAVKVGENFGLRVTGIGNVVDRIRAMGGR